MSDGKFTPGPWTFERVDLQTKGMADTTYQHIRAGHVGVADTYHCAPLAIEGFGPMSGYIPPRHGNPADARLIAAAPDLFAACEAVLRWYEVDSSEFNREAAIAACRAAISKARGQ